MRIKKLICIFTAVSVLVTGMMSIGTTAFAKDDFKFSDEYKSSPYYTNLMTALENSEDKSTMEKTLAVTLSQEGYKNYATSGIDIEQAREDGLLWTGAELRMDGNNTGNTEYTRWAQRYIMDRDESTQYLDCDWCAIYVSWCMYQAGYYDKEELKKCYYSYYANPTNSEDADGWILTYNLDQHNVWYTASANKQLERYDFNTYYNTNVDPFEISYKPGGLVFFSWDGLDGDFDHVAIVVDYDEDTHVLRYSNGNSDGQVITREIDLDVEEEFRGTFYTKNSNRIAAYAEYDEIKPFEQREINSETNSITWDINTGSGIRIYTDSESKICKVYVDDEYLGSNIESNMFLREGMMAIGRSELVNIPVGDHTLTLAFDDGTLNIPLRITDGTEESTDPTEGTNPTEPTEPKTPEISAKSLSLNAGKTASLKVTNGKASVWLSSENSVVTVKNGKITALKKGTATVYALLDDSTYLRCKVSVKSNPKLSKSSVTVKKGKIVKIAITGKASGVGTVCSSSKKSVAKVVSKASDTSVKIKGVKKGSAVITVKVNGVPLKLKVKVK